MRRACMSAAVMVLVATVAAQPAPASAYAQQRRLLQPLYAMLYYAHHVLSYAMLSSLHILRYTMLRSISLHL